MLDAVGSDTTREAANALVTIETVPAVSDTWLDASNPHTAHGTASTGESVAPLQRAFLIGFDSAAVGSAVGTGTPTTVEIVIPVELCLLASPPLTVEAFAMTAPWTEDGATWSCADDTDPTNSTLDCTTTDLWDPSTAVPWGTTSDASTTVTAGCVSELRLDVTAAVASGLPADGWAVVVSGAAGDGIKVQQREHPSGGGWLELEVTRPDTESGLCDDGADNDVDGAVDCADGDCASDPACASEICDNGLDEDGDGKTDCADDDCVSFVLCTLPDELDCADGFDNDGDGYVDCADSDCAPKSECSGGELICSDGVDNDGDGDVDCADADCVGTSSCATSSEMACDDLIDNDLDGQVDCCDWDCSMDAACALDERDCFAGHDDDGDGGPDCGDDGYCQTCSWDCQGGSLAAGSACYGSYECAADANDPFCMTEARFGFDGGQCSEFCDPATSSGCSSGVDCIALAANPALGLCGDACVLDADCASGFLCRASDMLGSGICGRACAVDSDCEYGAVCTPAGECVRTFEDCWLAGDEDRNGTADCADPACATDFACAAMGGEVCDNGVDDEGDSWVDCYDPDCDSWPGCGGWETCDNGVDDDGDAYVDCADPDCSTSTACAPSAEVCDDGFDNDGDGDIDCCDGDCLGGGSCSGDELSCADLFDDDGDGRFDCADTGWCRSCSGYCDSGAGAHGTSCGTSADCASDAADPFCFAEKWFGVPDGACSEFCDPSMNTCAASGMDCVPLSADSTQGLCVNGCSSDSNCDPGEVCQWTDLLSAGMCVAACIHDGDCGLDSRCGGGGHCVPLSEDCYAAGDEDGNGWADCADPACASTVCVGETNCADGIDDDGNGLVDCCDFGCIDDIACGVGFHAELSCGDGLDNDSNGAPDCLDLGWCGQCSDLCVAGGSVDGEPCVDASSCGPTSVRSDGRSAPYCLRPDGGATGDIGSCGSGCGFHYGGTACGGSATCLPLTTTLPTDPAWDFCDSLSGECLPAFGACAELCGAPEDCPGGSTCAWSSLLDERVCVAQCIASTDCATGACDTTTGLCVSGELCEYGVDADADGLMGCADVLDCASSPACASGTGLPGDACSSNWDCGNDAGPSACLDRGDHRGTCVTSCTPGEPLACSGLAECIPTSAGHGICVETCDRDFDCGPDGVCVTSEEIGASVCAPRCGPDVGCAHGAWCAVDGRCVPRSEDCADTIDNDGDGLVDCDDVECAGHGVCVVEPTEVSCANGRDDDGDGYADCDDPDCSATAACIDGICASGSDAWCHLVPPDFAAIAPELTASSSFYDAFATLLGTTQFGMSASPLDARRAAVVSGRVLSRSSTVPTSMTPLASARVSVVDANELGWAYTRSDGTFDMLVNGGEPVVLDIEYPGYHSAQRIAGPSWHGFASIGDVALVPEPTSLDRATVTAADLSVGGFVELPEVIDDLGSRKASVWFPPGTVVAAGSSSISAPFDFAFTEFTTGLDGQLAMPAPLPRASAYTYAFELTVYDGAGPVDGVRFEDATGAAQPVSFYVENVFGYPDGTFVPLGWYDADAMEAWTDVSGVPIDPQGQNPAWRAEDDAFVIGLQGVDADGRATLSPETLAGLSEGSISSVYDPAEILDPQHLEDLADRFLTGIAPETTLSEPVSVVRARLHHLSIYDINPGKSFPADAEEPEAEPEPEPEPECPELQSGSIIECDTQVLTEHLPIHGTGYRLIYRSDRTPGYHGYRAFTLPVTHAELRDGDLVVAVQVAGRDLVIEPDPVGDGAVEVVWDGRDAWGRPWTGPAELRVVVGRKYDMYYTPATCLEGGAFGAWPTVCPVELVDAPLVRAGSGYLFGASSARVGAGAGQFEGAVGWSLNVMHRLDPVTGQVLLGAGGRFQATAGDTTTRLMDWTPGTPGNEWGSIHADGAGELYLLEQAPDSSSCGHGLSWTLLWRVGDTGLDMTGLGSDCTPPGEGEDWHEAPPEEAPASEFEMFHNEWQELTGIIDLTASGDLFLELGREQAPVDGTGADYPGARLFRVGNLPSRQGVDIEGVGPATTAIDSGTRTPYVDSLAATDDFSVFFTARSDRTDPYEPATLYRYDTSGTILAVGGQNCDPAVAPAHPWVAVPVGDACLVGVRELEVAADGDVFVLMRPGGPGDPRGVIVRIDEAGRAFTWAGTFDPTLTTTSAWRDTVDWMDGPRLAVGLFEPTDIELALDGTVYVRESGAGRVRQISEGDVTTILGTSNFGMHGAPGETCLPDFGAGWTVPDTGQRCGVTRRRIDGRDGLAVAPDALYALVGNNVLRIERTWDPVAHAVDSEIEVASPDGRQIFVFREDGQHVETRDAVTGRVVRQFERFGDSLTIVEDPDGQPFRTEFASSGSTGDRTVTVTANVGAGAGPTRISGFDVSATGDLTAFRRPVHDVSDASLVPPEWRFTYDGNGLMRSQVSAFGRVSFYSYDGVGRLVDDESSDGHRVRLDREQEHDFAMTVVEDTTAEGRRRRIEFLEFDGGPERVVSNWVRRVTTPDGIQTTRRELLGGRYEIVDALDRVIVRGRTTNVDRAGTRGVVHEAFGTDGTESLSGVVEPTDWSDGDDAALYDAGDCNPGDGIDQILHPLTGLCFELSEPVLAARFSMSRGTHSATFLTRTGSGTDTIWEIRTRAYLGRVTVADPHGTNPVESWRRIDAWGRVVEAVGPPMRIPPPAAGSGSDPAAGTRTRASLEIEVDAPFERTTTRTVGNESEGFTVTGSDTVEPDPFGAVMSVRSAFWAGAGAGSHSDADISRDDLGRPTRVETSHTDASGTESSGEVIEATWAPEDRVTGIVPPGRAPHTFDRALAGPAGGYRVSATTPPETPCDVDADCSVGVCDTTLGFCATDATPDTTETVSDTDGRVVRYSLPTGVVVDFSYATGFCADTGLACGTGADCPSSGGVCTPGVGNRPSQIAMSGGGEPAMTWDMVYDRYTGYPLSIERSDGARLEFAADSDYDAASLTSGGTPHLMSWAQTGYVGWHDGATFIGAVHSEITADGTVTRTITDGSTGSTYATVNRRNGIGAPTGLDVDGTTLLETVYDDASTPPDARSMSPRRTQFYPFGGGGSGTPVAASGFAMDDNGRLLHELNVAYVATGGAEGMLPANCSAGSSDETPWCVEYEYDAAGRIIGADERAGDDFVLWEYTYHPATGRLASAERTDSLGGSPRLWTWTYDENGNRTGTTDSGGTDLSTTDIEVDGRDRLLQYGDRQYVWDDAGMLQEEWRDAAGTPGVRCYDYSPMGPLESVTLLPIGVTDCATSTVAWDWRVVYANDAIGRRIGRIEYDATGAIVDQRGWLYADFLRPVAELDGTGTIVRQFVYQTGRRVPDLVVDYENIDAVTGHPTLYRLISDRRGSPRALVRLVDPATTDPLSTFVAARMEYGPFGERTLTISPDVPEIPFGFAGGHFDPTTDLVRFGFRDYDAFSGRWTAADPIGFAGGLANLYEYVGSDPVSQIDPRGTFSIWTLVGAGAVIIGAGAVIYNEISAVDSANDATALDDPESPINAAIRDFSVPERGLHSTQNAMEHCIAACVLEAETLFNGLPWDLMFAMEVFVDLDRGVSRATFIMDNWNNAMGADLADSCGGATSEQRGRNCAYACAEAANAGHLVDERNVGWFGGWGTPLMSGLGWR